MASLGAAGMLAGGATGMAALQEQLGLKLESATARNVVIVDRVGRPTPN